MTFSPTCPEPMHRLFAIVGKDRIDQEMATTDWPNLAGAVAYLMLEEHGPDDWRRGADLMVEAGMDAGVLELDPEQFWVMMLAMMSGLDPATGEPVGPPVHDHPRPRVRPHGPRRGPFRR